MSTQPIGLDSALSRISQIQGYQQQLLDPTAAVGAGTSGTNAAAYTTPSTTTSGAGSSPNFASLLGSLTEDSALTSALGGTGSAADTSAGGLGSSGASGAGSLLSSLTGGGGLTGTGASGGSGSALLSQLTSLAAANPSLLSSLTGSSGATGAAGLTGALGAGAATAVTGASADAPAAVQAMTTQANALCGKPYVWGGGHGGWGEQPGYDCSGFVSAVLHAGGYLSTPQDTQSLPSAAGIESGPGQYVTIYDRTDAGMSDNHVIIDINGQFYESGGESGNWGGGGGVAKIATPPASYLSTFNLRLHPAGL